MLSSDSCFPDCSLNGLISPWFQTNG
jgi:hypothetical protein